MKKKLAYLFIMVQLPLMIIAAGTKFGTKTYYGKVKAEGKGVANVRVTDGTQIVLTDKAGKYKLESSRAADYVYISIPSGYEVPMMGKVPGFYEKTDSTKEKKEEINFELKRSQRNDDKHVLIVWADPQVYFEENMPEVGKGIDDVRDLLSTRYPGESAYGIVCGDIIGDINREPTYFESMRDTISKSGIPFFYVKGNHDMDLDSRTNEGVSRSYKRYFGPTYYSFDRGQVHYVILDDVFSIAKSYLYVGYLTEQQLQWLEQDLQTVPKGSTVVVAMHIPTYSREARNKDWGNESTMKVLNNRSALYDILQGYKVHIMTGHEHYNENYILSDSIYEHVHAPLSTLFWQAPMACDGTPGGYGVYEIDGSDVKWYYKSVGKASDYQFALYQRGADVHKKDAVIANVWNYDPTWKVEWSEDGKPKGEMARYTGYDPSIVDYCEKNNSKFKFKYIGAGKTEHLFYAEPEKDSSEVKVRVTDHCGQVYEQEIRQRKK